MTEDTLRLMLDGALPVDDEAVVDELEPDQPPGIEAAAEVPAEIARLAVLSKADYGAARKDAAKALGMGVLALDAAVKAARLEHERQQQAGVSAEAFAAEIERLSRLPEIEYRRTRKDAAKALFADPRDVDAAVKAERLRQQKAALSTDATTAEIERLSQLPQKQCAQERKAAAQKLLMTVGDLDAAIAAEKASAGPRLKLNTEPCRRPPLAKRAGPWASCLVTMGCMLMPAVKPVRCSCVALLRCLARAAMQAARHGRAICVGGMQTALCIPGRCPTGC